MLPIPDRSSITQEIQASITLTIPLAASQLAQAATGFVDTIIMGWLGPNTLAAGGLGAAIFMTCYVGGLGIITGVIPLIAQAHGAQNKPRIRQLTAQGLWLSLFIAIPVMWLLTRAEIIMQWIGQSPAITQPAQTYLNILTGAYFPAIAFIMLRGVVSSIGAPRAPMVIALGGLSFNIIANYVLAFGKLGFPALGLQGVAIASVMNYWGIFLALLLYIFWHRQLKHYHLFAKLKELNLPLLRELLHLGLPIGVSFTTEAGLFSVTTFLMGLISTEILAAHQIVFQTTAIIFMVPLGMSYATTIRVGQWLGSNDHTGIARSAYVGMFLSVSFMLLMATGILLFPTAVIGLYLDLSQPDNAALIPIVSPLLRVAALSLILDGVQTTAAGALRGLQDTKIPMFLSFTAFWIIGLGSGYILGFRLGWGGVGLWSGQAIGVATAALLFVSRFRRLLGQQRARKLSEGVV
ncbi:MATE family efflux transporter [filamentous cyanobacterium LEGE 11480]|uniref:Probable multidrug resistance protein NorM n=1 Tax=Romeriopsis navalis LEGE 11480 TaxID=2777977 RepID=A0A928Z409_9CYAN|nr:MATE family efflux transporter [Romeriopsis navalis]MBE9031249.1 MATE family efflux transporter [Romeriopsis navalis LEGE 11480]